MSTRRKTTIKLKGDDAALIMRANGVLELQVPEGEEGDTVPEHVAILMAVAEHLMDEDFREEMLDFVKQECCSCSNCLAARAALN